MDSVMIHNDVSIDKCRPSSSQSDLAALQEFNETLVQVLIPRPLKTLLTYRIRHQKDDLPQLGECLWVPLGGQELMGCLWKQLDLSTSQDHEQIRRKARKIILRLKWLPVLPQSLRDLIEQISQYYHVSLGEALHLASRPRQGKWGPSCTLRNAALA